MWHISAAGEDSQSAYWVDQMIRYMEELASTATDAYVQKHTCIAVWNHSPVSGMPYWHILIRIVPDLRHQFLLIEG
jgi:hypothetical protein